MSLQVMRPVEALPAAWFYADERAGTARVVRLEVVAVVERASGRLETNGTVVFRCCGCAMLVLGEWVGVNFDGG